MVACDWPPQTRTLMLTLTTVYIAHYFLADNGMGRGPTLSMIAGETVEQQELRVTMVKLRVARSISASTVANRSTMR